MLHGNCHSIQTKFYFGAKMSMQMLLLLLPALVRFSGIFSASCCVLFSVHGPLVDVCRSQGCSPGGGSSRVSGLAHCGHAGALRCLSVAGICSSMKN